MDTADPLYNDAHHHLRPFCDPREIEKSGARVIVRGEGCFVEDQDGRRLLDGMAGLWCVQVGYGRPELVEAATRQLERLPYYNTFFGTTNEPVAQLVGRLRDLTPDGLDWFLFANSGSEAVDTAVRLARLYWQRAGRPERRVVIGRTYGYHGSTMVGVSAGGMAGMHAQGDLPLPDFAHIPPPYPFEDGPFRGEPHPEGPTQREHATAGAPTAGSANTRSLEEYGRDAADELQKRIREIGPERVAAFIGEPLMGAGGVIVPPDTYWPRIQEICREHDVLLIADEVICGFGRTGQTWGCDTFGIAPDLMTMAKGLTSGYVPMSAVALGPRVAASLRDGGILQHGFTYSGHPVAAAVACANLELIERGGLVARVREHVGPRLQRGLASLSGHPIVGEVRGVGAIAYLEIVRDRASRARFEPAGRAAARLRDRCLDEGLIVRAIREGVAVCPPFVISDEEIDSLVERLGAALDRTEAELRSA